jgi:hypothetical protein
MKPSSSPRQHHRRLSSAGRVRFAQLAAAHGFLWARAVNSCASFSSLSSNFLLNFLQSQPIGDGGRVRPGLGCDELRAQRVVFIAGLEHSHALCRLRSPLQIENERRGGDLARSD